MNYSKYKILKFINNCPDVGIPKIVIHNALNINNTELDKIIDELLSEKLIYILNYKKDTLYSIASDGSEYLKKFHKLKFKAFFEKYLFSFILSLIFFLVGLILR